MVGGKGWANKIYIIIFFSFWEEGGSLYYANRELRTPCSTPAGVASHRADEGERPTDCSEDRRRLCKLFAP